MLRRDVLVNSGKLFLFLATPLARIRQGLSGRRETPPHITLFLGGDVMTGRGIDQVLPHPGDPGLHEPYMKSADGYVRLAEAANGPIPRPVSFAYIWGDALDELERVRPDVRIVNLETAVTTSDDAWPGKGIHYRMHPANAPCLTAARIDCCAHANNHVLDWGHRGLDETLSTLLEAKVAVAGAGRGRAMAEAPAILEVPGKGRVIVLSAGSPTSGIPRAWAASNTRPGVNLLERLDDEAVSRFAAEARKHKGDHDIVVASIHWGDNWGFEIPPQHRRFAHRLIDAAQVDVVHGHSSHHPRGIEVYRGKPILYGCGDLINDYEGIGGHEEFRGELGLMYFLTIDAASGKLVGAEMTPVQMKRFQAVRATREDAAWMRDTLSREGRRLSTRVKLRGNGKLTLQWQGAGH